MTPVDLPETATPDGFERKVYTSTDPEVADLVVMRDAAGRLYCEWELSPDEIHRLMRGERIRLWIWTYHQKLQPVAVSVTDAEREQQPVPPNKVN